MYEPILFKPDFSNVAEKISIPMISRILESIMLNVPRVFILFLIYGFEVYSDVMEFVP